MDDDLVLITDSDLDLIVVDVTDEVCRLLTSTDVVDIDDDSRLMLQIDGNRFTPYKKRSITLDTI